MAGCRHYDLAEGGDAAFAVDAASIVYGPGAIDEAGEHLKARGAQRVALFTDRRVGLLEPVDRALRSLRAAGLDVALYDEVRIEPSDASFLAAARFAASGNFDGYLSVGGGSVMDTCKAALLYATYPADFLTYVNAPIGAGEAVPGPLPPHVACPTTCGTGSECTGIAVCEIHGTQVKTGISSKMMRPALALIDPRASATLPPAVVAASGFDVLCHAIESYTARPYTQRPRPARPTLRPMSQGSNPFSDLGSLEALRLCSHYLVRAVADARDEEARHGMVYAATLAGIAFGNAGVHLPHGMAYAVAGQVRDFRLPGYPPDHALVPHGLSVALCAPAAFRYTAAASRAAGERHLTCAGVLGAPVRRAKPDEGGPALAERLIKLMKDAGLPGGLAAVGYGEEDAAALAAGTSIQARLLTNAPRQVPDGALPGLFREALHLF